MEKSPFIKEMFKDDLELLENKTVIKFMDYTNDNYVNIRNLFMTKKNKLEKINDCIWASNRMLLVGTNDTETLQKIIDILNE